MSRRLILMLLVILACASAAVRSPLTLATAQTTQTPTDGLDVVRAAYNITLDKYFRPLSPADLLQGSWDNLTAAAARNDLPAPPALQPLPDDREAAFTLFAVTYRAYLALLPATVSPLNIGFTVVDGILRSLKDTHSGFIPPSSRPSDVTSAASDLPVGLGIRSTTKAPWLVTEVAPDGPAAQAGLQPGDVLVASDGQDIIAATQPEFNVAVGGPEGSSHRLTVARGKQTLEITVTRGRYYFPPLGSRLLSGGVGYLRLTNFVQTLTPQRDNEKILDELDRRLDELDAQGATSLIVDLRSNPGGFSPGAWLGRFLPETALSFVQYDARGHRITSIVSGHMHRRQLPMAVLVNGGSASSSEIFASAMHETDRAVLVGTKTAGALRSAQLFTLPEGASMQLSVADVETPYNNVVIEGKGYPVDIDVADDRTPDDYAAGRDPQLAAAVAALPQAPPPPAFDTTYTGVSEQQLIAMFSPYFPDASQIPLTDRLTRVQRLGSVNATHVNQGFGSGRDPLALQATYRRRGWLGAHAEFYWADVLTTPQIAVAAELYATEAGAEEGLVTNDAPDLSEQITAPVHLGDDTVASKGLWLGAGGVSLSWRRGNVVFTVSYDDAPGFENMDEVVQIARLVDDAYRRQPLSRSVGFGETESLPWAA